MPSQLSTKDLRRVRFMNPVSEQLRLDQYLFAALGIGLTGDVYYADPTSGNDAQDGKSGPTAFKTLQAAIDACTANNGDVIVRMRGGEAVTSTVNINKAGITIIPQCYGGPAAAMGEYFSTYSTTLTGDPVAIITADGVTVAGIAFAGADAGATFFSGAALLIGGEADATPWGVRVTQCRFPKWGLDNRIGVAVEGSSDCQIDNCDFEGVGSALAIGIYVQGATANINILNNTFRDCTYGVQFGAFAGGGPDFVMKSNIFHDSKVLSAGVSSEANPGVVADNWCNGATDSGSYNDTVNNLNTGGIVFSDQHYAE